MGGGPLVDYGKVAPRYHAGRALPADTLDRWAAAVRAAAGEPRPGAVVLDLGAGTGIFAEAWSAWGAGRVLGLDLSGAMLAECRTRFPSVAQGSAAAIRLRDCSVDVVWMSAVLHHLPDHAACAAEVRRVLRPGGHLLIRGFCPDRSRIAWLDHLPGAERARARFPTAARIDATFTAAGLVATDAREVEHVRGVTGADAAGWIDSMRGAD